MKKVELKRIAEFLRKGKISDEKTPFAHQSTVPGHGSIPKSLEADNQSIEKECSEIDSDKIEGPMSISRKMCFVLSFNMWILYFLMFGWLIPCRNLNCDSMFDDAMDRNLTSIWLLTNLEPFNVKGGPSLSMIGYTDGPALNVAALRLDDGTYAWNNNLTFIPRRIQCKFENTFDINGDGIGDCLLTGYNDVYAFNASNGIVFWHQNLPSEKGNIVSRFHPTTEHNRSTYLIGTCGDEIVILDSRRGTEVSQLELPCSSPFDIRVIPDGPSTNFTLWSIVCDYGDKVEVWGFGEHDLLDGGYLKIAGSGTDEFTPIFRRDSNSSESIDLGCDVMPIPGGSLLLSWSERVAMVTPNATAWERRFTYPLTVASIAVGHFTNTNELQIAAAVHNNTNSIVYILEITNGTTVATFLLNDREVQTLEKIAGDFDSLVVKSVIMNEISYSLNNMSDPVPRQWTNFALIHYNNKVLDVKDVVTTSTVLGSALNSKENGETDLLIMTTRNGSAFFHKYVIHRSSKEDVLFCAAGVNPKKHFSTEI